VFENNSWKSISFQSSVSAHKDGEGGPGGKGHEKHEKFKKCFNQTKALKECCPSSNSESMKDDPDCKHHLEGIEDKEKKQKFKAYKCFSECILEKGGIFVDGNFNKEKLIESTENHLTLNNDLDFKDIAMDSIDFCLGKSEKIVQHPIKFY
jgi:hypothetical protein